MRGCMVVTEDFFCDSYCSVSSQHFFFTSYKTTQDQTYNSLRVDKDRNLVSRAASLIRPRKEAALTQARTPSLLTAPRS